ncbi:hypothetical protein [Amycolatopsis nalaikhensis]|uniref:Uncharacterized protein n=1 Tax=Amycolatopsis nalaikhensis TaxID=715472 RepID=A0ABY8XJN4_9PSEU|nr:hypothetical protein [Amycolatopsis sp. 2-2]WIV55836.1 hypothetical protein QP939_44705 [Amycolatopsis sp. 2-2]
MTHPPQPGQPGQHPASGAFPGQQGHPAASGGFPAQSGQPGPGQPGPGQHGPGQPGHPASGGFPAQPGHPAPSSGFAAQQPLSGPSGGFPGQPDPGQQGYSAASGGFPAQPGYPAPGGFPAQAGQPGYPPPPGGFPGQPYAPAPYPAPGYGMQPPKPSGVTAIIAGVLAVLGGLLYLVGLVGSVITLADFGFVDWIFVVPLVKNLLLAALLLPGGILLFLRKPAGRMLTIVGCALAIVLTIASVVLNAVGVWYFAAGIGGIHLGGAFVGLVMVLVPAGAALVLALVKPTARWCGRA